MARLKNREFWQSAKYNNAQFMQYFNRLTELAMSMFDWKNLPDSVDPRYLELALFGDGMCVFFKDDAIGYLALRCMIGGTLNVYQIPTMRTAYSANGYNMPLDETNSVIIFNNYLHTNSTLEVENFSRKLWELDRSIEVNAKAQKTPILLQCEESQRLTLKNMYMQYDGNMPVIYGDKNLNPNSLKAISTGAPYVADKLYQLKTQYWNEALTYLGISNVSFQKKERMVSDEVMRNQGGTIASRYSRLQARREACEQINRMFGLNIDVDYREDYREADDEVMFGGESGDDSMSDMVIDLRTQ